MDILQHFIDLYEKTGKYYTVYTIYGGLLDNYIITGDNLKTTIITEEYLNEWSSDHKYRLYNKISKSY